MRFFGLNWIQLPSLHAISVPQSYRVICMISVGIFKTRIKVSLDFNRSPAPHFCPLNYSLLGLLFLGIVNGVHMHLKYITPREYTWLDFLVWPNLKKLSYKIWMGKGEIFIYSRSSDAKWSWIKFLFSFLSSLSFLMAQMVFSLGDEHVVNNSPKELIQTTINVTMTINVLQANVDDLTTSFVVLEVSTICVGFTCCNHEVF